MWLEGAQVFATLLLSFQIFSILLWFYWKIMFWTFSRNTTALRSVLYIIFWFLLFSFKFRPDLFDYNNLRANQHTKNLNHAFDIAFEKLGIAKLLDAVGETNNSPILHTLIWGKYTWNLAHTFPGIWVIQIYIISVSIPFENAGRCY